MKMILIVYMTKCPKCQLINGSTEKRIFQAEKGITGSENSPKCQHINGNADNHIFQTKKGCGVFENSYSKKCFFLKSSSLTERWT